MKSADEFLSMSDRYPPRNRKVTGLGPIQIEIEDAFGKLTLDANRAAVVGLTRKLPVLGTVANSVLSGQPGYLYRTVDVELALTEAEILRLMRLDLQPQEVKKLHETFGVFYETHDDFYDEETFEALQPREEIDLVADDEQIGGNRLGAVSNASSASSQGDTSKKSAAKTRAKKT